MTRALQTYYTKMYFLGWLIILATLFSSCGGEEEPLFVMDLQASLVIPPGLNNFDTHIFIIRDIPTGASNFITDTVDESQVEAILPNRAQLITVFNNIDWAIIREISIQAVSITDPDLRREIFWHDRINPNTNQELRLFSSLSEVKDILLQDRMNLEVRLNFRQTTRAQVESRLTMNFVANGPR